MKGTSNAPKVLMAFKLVQGHHTGEALRDVYSSILQSLDLNLNDVVRLVWCLFQ